MTKKKRFFDDPPAAQDEPEGGLFGTPAHKLVRKADPDTSHLAASQAPTTALEMEVLGVIVGLGDCTADEVLAAMPGHRYNSVTPRFKALLEKGLIRDTGRRKPGGSGRLQRIMAATALGRQCSTGNNPPERK